jgi:sugar diacid utilization regulator
LERLTVRELVDEANLGLVLVSGEPGLDRVIEGIHLSDLEDPTPWMTSGMVLVTTGESFASSMTKGLHLLERLEAIQAVALVVGVGHYLDAVPMEIVARARALKIPVFEAPLSVPFRTIVTYVYNALASSDMHRLRRSLAVQTHLLDLLVEERSVAEILASLSSLIDMPLVLFDATGSVVATSAGGDGLRRSAQRLWAEYERAGSEITPLGVLEVGHERFYYRKIAAYGVVERVLAGVAPQAGASRFAETALSFAQRLLMLDLLRSGEQLMLMRRMRAHTLDDFLQERSRGDEARQRLLEQRLDLDHGWRLVTCSVDASASDDDGTPGERRTYASRVRLLNAVDGFFGERSAPFLSMLRGDVCLVLTSFGDGDSAAVRTMLEHLRDVLRDQVGARAAVGCCGHADGLDNPGVFVRQAEEALRRSEVSGCVSLHDDVSRGFRLIDEQSPEILQAVSERLVEPLRAYDALHQTYLLVTLQALYANSLSANRTAAALFVHRNTLRKRLQRIEAVLGVNLANMDDIAELYLALRADELVRERV